MNFKELNLIQLIQRALTDTGYTTPMEIQTKAIGPISQGKDILGCAQTGAGKTAAFAIPILQQLEKNKTKSGAILALVLNPAYD